MALTRAHVRITGRVQGVCFRMYTYERARELDLTGWVRNRYDGSVEAVFEGEVADVRPMIDWCHIGPPASRVMDVHVEWEEATDKYTGFSMRHTG